MDENPDPKKAPSEFRITGRWVLRVFLMVFGVFLAANLLLTFYAFDSWTGLESESAYEDGVAYNETLEAARLQAGLGWQVEPVFLATGHNAGRLRVSLRGDKGRPLQGLSARALFRRPTHEGVDVDLELEEIDAGIYGAEVQLPKAGQWDLRLHFTQGTTSFRRHLRVLVK